MAIFGWTNPDQAAVYTRKANRATMAQMAAGKLVLRDEDADESGTSIPAPSDPVWGSGQKSQ